MALVVRNHRQDRRQFGARDAWQALQMGRALYRQMPSFSRGATAPTRGMTQRIITAAHEPKNLDALGGSYQLLTSSASFVQMNNTSQGTSAIDRTGRQTLNCELQLRSSFQLNTASAWDLIRLVILVDKECRGAQAGWGDLFQYTTFGTAAVNSPFNFDNVPSRFTILHDETFALNSHWSGAPTIREVLVRKKLDFKTHFYNTNTGAIADVDSGSIQFCTLGSLTSGATTHSWDSRLVFRDL